MKDTFKTMVQHPIASYCIVCGVTSGIANIIRAVKGAPATVVKQVVKSETE